MTDNRWVIQGALFLVRTSMGYQVQSIGSISPSLIDDLGIGHAEVGMWCDSYTLQLACR